MHFILKSCSRVPLISTTCIMQLDSIVAKKQKQKQKQKQKKIYCDDHTSLPSTTAVQIWIISYILHVISLHGKIWTQWVDLAPNVWLHSSVGRASHRYRGGHGFESRWSPDFFQASSFQLLNLKNLLRWSHFTFIVAIQVLKKASHRNHFIITFPILSAWL